MTDALLVSRTEGVTTLTLNRPQVRNAVDGPTMSALHDALRACDDDGTRVIVIAGAGGAFCAGADIAAALSANITPAEGYRILTEHYAPVFRAIKGSPWPVIAAVDGAAAGLGCDLALACDLRLCSERARFAELFIKVGLVPDGGGTWSLPRLVGLGRAMEMMLTGERVDAAEALRIGLANKVYPTDTFAAEVAAYAARLAAQAPLALTRSKRAMLDALSLTFDEAMAREAAAQLEIFNSEDGFEGFLAFLEKRPPRWKGR